jgi:transcriptional regulator with XRE-family HTH domain
MIRLRVKEIAKQKGISQLKLGRMADIDAERMRRIFRYGDSAHSNLTLTSLDRIAKALGVDASDLIERIPEPNREEGQQP